MCNENDHQMCTRQVGEICGGNNDCCSRQCTADSVGVKRCEPLGGCRAECELCFADDDCCSGVCNGQETGQGICQPASAMCGSDGETCGGNPDCCAGSMCVQQPAPSGAHRCVAPSGDAACRTDGQSCAMPAECCGGHCVPSPAGQLECSSTCSPDGVACTSDGDCCAAGSTCQWIEGTLVCGRAVP
jgi:hypothetical protein